MKELDFVQLEIPDAQAKLSTLDDATSKAWRAAYLARNQIDLLNVRPHHAVAELLSPPLYRAIVVTTPEVPGRKVEAAITIVSGTVVLGAHLGKDFEAGVVNILGGHAEGYERTAQQASHEAIKKMARFADSIGADAVVGVRLDFGTLGVTNGMLMASATGTAVKLAAPSDDTPLAGC